MIQHTNDPEFNFDYIDEGIFIGSNACCQPHFDERLAAEGITADISLEGEKVDTPYGVESYLWLPTPDHHSPTIAQLTQGVTQLEILIALGKKVYVHCKLGHGRGPTLAIAYFAKSRSISVQEAFDFVKSKRDVIHLDNVQLQGVQDYLDSIKN